MILCQLCNLKFWFLILVLVFGANSLNAQKYIHGIVKNEKGEALPFASIFLKRAKTGATTAEDGTFALRIKSTYGHTLDTLICSYVGYKPNATAVQLSDNFKLSSSLEIVLSDNYNALPEFEIIDIRLSAEDIVRQVLKFTRKNYIDQNCQSNGFYREMIYEDQTPIEMHEALITVNHASYPKSNFTRRAFKKYWDRTQYTMSYGTKVSEVFRHLTYFPNYVHPQDEVEIKALRSSLNQSKYGVNASPVGGPLDLVALDKVKYRYDFLDPKLIRKYSYQKAGTVIYNGQQCLVIRFRPREEYNFTYQQFNKKPEHALYQGELIISIQDYAVLQIKSQLSNTIDFSNYKGNPFIPFLVEIEVDYQRVNGKLILNRVETSQSNIKAINSKRVHYKAVRQLVLHPSTARPTKLNEENTIPIQHFTSIKYFTLPYSKVQWALSEESFHYSPPPKSFTESLRAQLPLEKQFEEKNSLISSIPLPIHPELQLAKDDSTGSDTIHPRLMESGVLRQFATEENNYSELVFKKLISYRREFYWNYLNLYSSDSLVQTSPSEELYRWEMSENGNYIFTYNPPNRPPQTIFNYTRVQSDKSNFQLDKLSDSPRHTFTVYTYKKNGEATNYLEIQDRTLKTIWSKKYVDQFEFLNDTILLYSLCDSTTLRVNGLYCHILGRSDKYDSLVYFEKDLYTGIHIKKSASNKHIFLQTENKTFTSNYLLQWTGTAVTTVPTWEETEGFVEMEHFKDSTLFIYTNQKDSARIYCKTMKDKALQPAARIYSSRYPIVDLQETSDYLFFAEYVSNSLILKRLCKRTRSIVRISLLDSICSFEFVNRNKGWDQNMVYLGYESPSRPYCEINVSGQNSDLVIEEKVKLNNHLKGLNLVCELVELRGVSEPWIPITVLYNKVHSIGSFKGLIVRTYGAYSALRHPTFNEEDFIYAKQGFVVAFVHVRGGGEHGIEWYYSGRQENKKSGINDFLMATTFLQRKFKIDPHLTIGVGTSAAGVILGAVANSNPEIFGGLIFDRPYLDLINTLTNQKLPLSIEEYMEWGDPSDSADFTYISSYSPYQNIQLSQEYPHMFFIGKYKDVQTPFWQIASFVRQIRKRRDEERILLLQTDFNSGHNGPANFELQIDEMADKFGFINYVVSGDINQ